MYGSTGSVGSGCELCQRLRTLAQKFIISNQRNISKPGTLSFTFLMSDLHQDNSEGALMEYYLEGIALFKILLHYVTQMRRVTKTNNIF